MSTELDELRYRWSLLVCQDDEESECCGCENDVECLELCTAIKKLEEA